MSRSLQSSIEYFGGSNRWSRNDRDMVPWKSSIGLISSKISSRPEAVGTSSRPALRGLLDPGLPDLVAEQPVEAVGLEGEEVRDLERLADLRERDAAGGGAAGSGCCWRWACWRCARRPRGVLPRAAGLSVCAHAGRPRAEGPGSGQVAAQSVSIPGKGAARKGPLGLTGREPPPQCSCGHPLYMSQPEQDGPVGQPRQGSPVIPGVSRDPVRPGSPPDSMIHTGSVGESPADPVWITAVGQRRSFATSVTDTPRVSTACRGAMSQMIIRGGGGCGRTGVQAL